MYSTATSEVYISMEQMPHCRRVIDTLIHELAHHRQYRSTGEADDLTPIHMEKMQEIAADVVKIAALSDFFLRDLLKEVTW